jgi:poly[(R)-3-hydroxyalkanoate] polymerase subunit PhaC
MINTDNSFISTKSSSIIFMNLNTQDLFQDKLYSIDFMDVCIDWTRMNLEYMSIYIDTFLTTASDVHKLGRFDRFYDTWLSQMDGKLEHELGSNQFTNTLKHYMNSIIRLRLSCRRMGFPIEYYDVLFYSMKKFLMNFYALFYMRESAYSTPSEVEYRLGKITLRHYNNNSKNNLTNDGPPVLLVYAQINRFNILDISYDRSVVKNLMLNGLDVYVLDWGYSGHQDDNRSLDDYVKILGTVVDKINLKSKGEKLSIIGYCWGGLIALIFTTLHIDAVQGLALMASPVDSSKDNSLLATWARAVDADNMIDEFGHMDGRILDLAFIMRNPPRNLFDKYLKMFKHYGDKHFVDSFLAVENWLFSTPPIPGTLYRQIINDFYKGNLLISNGIIVSGRDVDLKNINIPLLSIVAENDDLVSPSSTLAVNEFVSSEDKDSIRIPGGHVALCISKMAHEKLWPEVADWIISRSRRKNQ